jgi:adenylate cyclase
LAAMRLPAWGGGLLGILAVGLLWVGAAFVFRGFGLLVPMVAPALALAGGFGTGSALLGYHALQQKRFVRKAFAQYVPSAVVDRIAADPSQLLLGGEQRVLSFVFTDIAGFTSMSERMAPEQLAETLNSYLNGVSTIVFDHGGTLDKYIGDAVVAFFGAPEDQPDHAARAIRCAVAIDDFAEAFRATHASVGFGVTRIGVNTGQAVVGNFGGDLRFDYTALGDTVNTAARLEAVNKHLGSRVCLSENAVNAARDAGAQPGTMRPIGHLVLKGKKDAVKVFEPLSGHDGRRATLAAYKKAFDALENAETDLAKAAFERLAESDPADAVVSFHVQRLLDGATDALIKMDEK